MLDNIQKIVVGKSFLISLILICLMFTSFAMSMEGAYASELDEGNEIGMDLDVEDKLENSQENEIMMESDWENDLMQDSYSLSDGTFNDIQNAIDNAQNGDTIMLSGTFVSTGREDTISLNKRLDFVSSSGATLDGNNQCMILKITEGGAQSSFTNLKFINGYADDRGGAAFVSAKFITFDNCVFENNHAEVTSGAIHTPYRAETALGLTLKDCNFTNNNANVAAGAVGAFSHAANIINCIFDSNYVFQEDGESIGGAIQIGLDTEPSYGNVINCIFKNNRAISLNNISHGGAGCVRNGSSYYNCIFINNSAGHGGALTYHASGNLYNCTLINNTASEYGGGISIMLNYLDYMDLNITNSVFKGNKAPLGGAAKFDGLNIKIEDSIFEDNYATEYGGALNIEAYDVKVINSEFNNNIANIDGGAMYIKGNNTYVADSIFISNDAIPDANKLNDGLGGAIYANSTKALVENNVFKFNTARNGSAIYFDEHGVEFTLKNNTLYKNQAWVYHLPIFAHEIYYGDVENIKSVIFGGNNIADYDNLAVSNAIYNAADHDKIEIDGENPVSGATMSGDLYQDDREYNMEILMTVEHEDGTVVYNNTLNSNYLGEVSDNLADLKPGKYYVTAKHFEDNYYKAITNATVFNVIPKIDNRILKSSNNDTVNYGDYVVWTLNITNNGPNDATGVVVYDALPDGLLWMGDDSEKYDPNSGILDIGDLKAGETFVFNVITQVNKTGDIVNRANVTGIEFDIDLNNNHDEKLINVPPAADLAIVKSVNVSNPKYNELVKWTLTVKNNGPDIAHNVEVLDLLPDSLIFDSCSSVNYDEIAGIWRIGTLGVNKSVKLNIVARVNSTGVIKNNASVTLDEYDYDMSNNFDDAEINASSSVDVSVAKSVNATEPDYNDLVKWTVTVINNGPDVAHGVRVVDVLPDSLEFISCSSAKYNDLTGVWNIGTLEVNKSVKLSIVCRVKATGKIVNKVNVTSDEFDYDLSNNHAQKAINVASASDLEVQKTVNESNPHYGDSIKWIIKVTNNGPDVAHDVKVADLLPESLIFVSATGGYNKSSGLWQIDALNPSASVKFSIVCKVNTTGEVINRVNVTSSEYDPDLSNNYDDEKINVALATDLEIVKSANVSNANYTDLVNWTLIIKNNGPDNATGVKVYDILPEGFIYVDSSLGKGSYSQNVFDIGNLNAGESLCINIITQANNTGEFLNMANITGNEYDYNLENNVANKSIIIDPAADLEVVKLANESNPNFRDLVKWTVIVKNNGPNAAHHVKVSDVLPESLIWENDDSQGKYNHTSGIWNIGTLKKGKSVRLNIFTRVNATGNISNFVSVTADEFDHDLSNNRDNKSIFVNSSGDLAIVKIVNASEVNYGDFVKWTLIASNRGPDKVTGIVVEDILPNGLIMSNYTASKGFYDEGVWNLCCLEKGEVQRLEIICKVNVTGNITNLAKISGIEYDPNLTNNDDNESLIVPSAADILVLKEVNNKTPLFGDLITWTITVKNIGPDMATDVRVFDALPDELIFNDYASSRGIYGDGVWTLDYLNSGESEYLNITCYVNGLGSIINNVSAIANEYDINMSNNYDDEIINSSPVSDLSVEKFANVSIANYNDLVKWTIIVSNEGFNSATGVIVEDALPKALEFISVSGDGYYEGNIWHIGDLEVGGRKKLEILSKVIETGDITNFAIVSGNEEDPNLSNNEAQDTVHINPACDLSITKTVSKYVYDLGDLVTYTIKLSNAGPDDALNVKVNEEFDESLVLKSVKATRGNFDTSSNEWSIDELAAGGEENLLLNFEAIKEGVFRNVVSAISDTFDIDLTNNDDFALVKIVKNLNNTPIPYAKNVSDNLPEHDVSKAKDIRSPISNLRNYPTANLIALLVVSTLISIVFGCGDIIKKR
ncbi:hypothetical protein [Methanobrevibacter sp.]|uniref:hypothetical protein n=1 Tax=Methanobrevibacter sp. TaxID=66852 RepID=UPI0038900CFE